MKGAFIPLFNLQYSRNKCYKQHTDLLNPLVPKAHNRECQNLQFPLPMNPVNFG